MTTARQQEPGVIPEWTLGWRLQRALAHAGMTSQQIAEELGVTRSTISRWMNDHGAPPRAIYVKQWALLTGVPAEWLLDQPITEPTTRRYPAGSPAGRARLALVPDLPADYPPVAPDYQDPGATDYWSSGHDCIRRLPVAAEWVNHANAS